MTTGELLAWVGQVPDVCVCGQIIPDSAVYFGFPLSDDADAPLAFVNEWHEFCLGEWGYARCNPLDPEGIADWGIKHRHYEDSDA